MVVFVSYHNILKLLFVRIQVTSLLNLHMVVSHKRSGATIAQSLPLLVVFVSYSWVVMVIAPVCVFRDDGLYVKMLQSPPAVVTIGTCVQTSLAIGVNIVETCTDSLV